MDVPTLKLSDDVKKERVIKKLCGFVLPLDSVAKIQDVFNREAEAGLAHGLENSCLQMENTFVSEMLNGHETGDFLALDLGGTNFRVMLLEMKDGKIVREEVEYYSVPEEKRLGEGTDLFDFLAQCIKDFTKKFKLTDVHLPLGFTFSFPMHQKAINVGILVNWTKSFNCKGVIGKDAVKMLNEALERVGDIKVDVVGVLNDSTGTLVKGYYDDPSACIGLILGTGCNGAYFEPTVGIGETNRREVVIDPEFGAFGDNGCIDFIKTPYDLDLDRASLLPHSFTFEKYFAGKYMGELLRLIVTDLAGEKLLFQGGLSAAWSQSGSVTTPDISHIEEDTINDRSANIMEMMKRLNQENVTEDDIAVLKYICELIAERSAQLVAIPLVCLMDRMLPRDMYGIAVTGSLYQSHPRLKALLEKYLGRLAPGKKCKTFLSDDGSGKGAGLVAAIATHAKKA